MICKKLSYGDTIGIIAPAGPEKPEAIKNGINFLKNKGFNIKEGKHLYDKWGYLAGYDKDRTLDFMGMFIDKNVDMILCIRGGYGSMRTLPYIDFNIIQNNPKIFVGFSDITTYLNSIYQKCGIITFHGPMASSNFEDVETLNSFFNTLMKGNNPYRIENPNGIPIKCYNKGIVEGNLVGGNLSLICSTIGTPYEIDTKDKILFIEEVSEEPYAVDRMLTQLTLAGKLQQCKGIILGQFTKCDLPDYERSLKLEEVLEDRILTLKIPTLTNVMSGHDYPKLTLPIGARIKLDSINGTVDVLESVVY